VATAEDLGTAQERVAAVSSSALSIHRDAREDVHDPQTLLILAASSSEECRKKCEKAYGKCSNRPGGMKQCADERKACYKKCK
jgi:hypothetical protein